VSDGDPPFARQELNSFVMNYGIAHIISSPMHQGVNDGTDSAVKIMKSLLLKTYKEGGDSYEAMLEQRNTPPQDKGRSPADVMNNKDMWPHTSLVPRRSRLRQTWTVSRNVTERDSPRTPTKYCQH